MGIKLINPPIYSFRPWLSFIGQPTGILRIGNWLKKQGHNVSFLDCLPNRSWKDNEDCQDLASFVGVRRCGNWEEEHISKPLYYYGLSLQRIKEELKKDIPEEIWITSSLTYYWEGTHEVVSLCKKEFPGVPVKLGGIYPTLCEKHARESAADEVIVGEIAEASDLPPAMELMREIPDYAVVKPSRGCPHSCSMCSVAALDGHKMRQRDPQSVFDEIKDRVTRFNIRKFLFWASNLLVDPKRHFEKILELIIESNLAIEIEASEGIQPNLLTLGLAKKMRKAGFSEITIPLESASEKTLRAKFHKQNTLDEYFNAVKIAKEAGFKNIRSFVLMGLPDQSLEEIIRGVVLAYSLGVHPVLMPFTPVPKSEEYNKHKSFLEELGLENTHPLLWPFASSKSKVFDLERINRLVFCCDTLDELKNLIALGKLSKREEVDKTFIKEVRRIAR